MHVAVDRVIACPTVESGRAAIGVAIEDRVGAIAAGQGIAAAIVKGIDEIVARAAVDCRSGHTVVAIIQIDRVIAVPGRDRLAA